MFAPRRLGGTLSRSQIETQATLTILQQARCHDGGVLAPDKRRGIDNDCADVGAVIRPESGRSVGDSGSHLPIHHAIDRTFIRDNVREL